MYNDRLENLPLKLPTVPKNNYSTFHLYVVLLEKNRDELYKLFLNNLI